MPVLPAARLTDPTAHAAVVVGAIGGALGGAAGGAIIGAFVGGPVGALAGAVIGGLVGGIAGAVAGLVTDLHRGPDRRAVRARRDHRGAQGRPADGHEQVQPAPAEPDHLGL
jgi:predicted lipid-binding transport protein (Tim44 family)